MMCKGDVWVGSCLKPCEIVASIYLEKRNLGNTKTGTPAYLNESGSQTNDAHTIEGRGGTESNEPGEGDTPMNVTRTCAAVGPMALQFCARLISTAAHGSRRIERTCSWRAAFPQGHIRAVDFDLVLSDCHA